MPKYRKKPVVIEAVLFDGTNHDEIKQFAQAKAAEMDECGNGKCLLIDTLEGTMTANIGDFIIKGVKGEFYPCKPDIFAATYESAEDGHCSFDPKGLLCECKSAFGCIHTTCAYYDIIQNALL